jgi:hypothetical protein
LRSRGCLRHERRLEQAQAMAPGALAGTSVGRVAPPPNAFRRACGEPPGLGRLGPTWVGAPGAHVGRGARGPRGSARLSGAARVGSPAAHVGRGGQNMSEKADNLTRSP